MTKVTSLTNKVNYIRHEFLLSLAHQNQLDTLVNNHPLINTRVAMIRELIDGSHIQQVQIFKQDQEFISQLNMLGNLINQFLKLAHTYALYGEPLSSELIIYKVDLFNKKLSSLIKANIGRHVA